MGSSSPVRFDGPEGNLAPLSLAFTRSQDLLRNADVVRVGVIERAQALRRALARRAT